MFGEIKNAQGEKLDYTFHPGRPDLKKIVVIGHGVTGNKDRPFIQALAEGLAVAGIPTLRFSFAGNGSSGGRFVDATITKETGDLGSILDALPSWTVAYVGHSMGGAVGVARASQDPRIRFLVSLAGMVHTAAFAQREFGNVTPDQGCMWDEPSCPLSSAYMKDLTQIDTLVGRGAKIQVPWLLVHGTEDDVVPIQDSRDILAQANAATTKMVEIAGSNHVFAGTHLGTMVTLVSDWISARFDA